MSTRQRARGGITADPLAELYRRPGFLLRHSHQIAVAVFIEECAAFDITPGQYGVLSIIAASPGVDQQTLARRIGLDPSTTGGIVARLVERGLLLRRVGATDRRARTLAVSEGGSRLLAAVGPAVQAAQRRLLAPLAPAEREVLVALLGRLIDAHGGVSRAPFLPASAGRRAANGRSRRAAGR